MGLSEFSMGHTKYCGIVESLILVSFLTIENRNKGQNLPIKQDRIIGFL